MSRRAGATVSLFVLFFAALLAFTEPARADPARVIPPGREAEAQALIADVGFGRDLGDGLRVASISILTTEIAIEVHRGGAAVGRLRLVPLEDAASGDVKTQSFAVKRRRLADEPRVDEVLDALTKSVAAHDRGGFYVPLQAASPAPPRRDQGPSTTGPRAGSAPRLSMALERRDSASRLALWVAAITSATLGAAALWLRRARPDWVVIDVNPLHLIPACVQLTIFSYWGLYWHPLRDYAPLILLQIAYAYVTDAAVSLAVRRKLVLGFAPLPIVGSINLFVQFRASALALSLAAIALAILSKALIRRREGGHVMNPSAFGVTVVALVNLASPSLGNGDNALRFSLPPNMTELILVLALVPMSRRPIVLVSLFAALSMSWYHIATGYHYFHPFWAPVFLSLTLLATDPATMPKTGPGRAIFGAILGIGFVGLATLLKLSGRSDFYAKVIPMPFVNLLAPSCDRWGERMIAPVSRALSPVWNRVHVGVWVAFVTVGLHFGIKEGAFPAKDHARANTPLLVRGREGQVRCRENRLFCEPFTVRAEIRGWVSRLGGR